MKSIFTFLRLLRNNLLGLNSLQARFDILQQKLDLLLTTSDTINTPCKLNSRENHNKIKSPLLDEHLIQKTSHHSDRASPGSRFDAQHNGPVFGRIAFLVHSLELVNHFGCVWDLLPEDSFDVILHGDSLATRISDFSRWGCKVVTSTELIQKNSKYQYLISNHPVSVGDSPLIKKLAVTNIRFMYAAGKSGWNLSEWNSLYDVILCFGPYHAAAFARNTDALILQMGYPRFDRYFTNQPNFSELHARYESDPLKKTIVWLPTWKTLSSVGYFDEEISQLSENYNVIVKLHPLMSESEPQRVETLKEYKFTHLITDTSDNLPLYQIADFMLFDYGGPPLAGIYTDKKLILLNVPEAESDDLTGESSPDISIREYLININASEKRIDQLLTDSSVWAEQQISRKMLREYYFAPYCGFSSNVAAGALMNLHHILKDRVNI